MSRTLDTLVRSRTVQIVVYVLVWTTLGMISVTQTLMSYAAQGDQAPIGLVARLALPTWYSWAVLAPVIYIAGRRLPLDEGRWTRNLPLHVALNAVVLVLAVLLVVVIRQAFGITATRGLRIELIGSVNTGLFTYWIVVLAAHGVGYYRDRRAEQVRAAELSTQLSKARLAALQAQLHPHFLFNTMHAISAFVRPEPDKAETMLAELAELLRLSMDGPDDPVVPLEQELEFVKRYLSIQKTRLGDRFQWELSVDHDVSTARVPSLILQPLVENAVEHGIAKRLGNGRLWIRVTREDGLVSLEVSNDGPEVTVESLDRSNWRVGLRNTSDRLTQTYGPDYGLALRPRDGGGLEVRVSIPWEAAGLARGAGLAHTAITTDAPGGAGVADR